MSSKVTLRAAFDKLLAVAGLAIVVVQLYLVSYSLLNVLLLAVGILLMYIGTWRLMGTLVHKRVNKELRAELDEFISLVRRLTSSRVNGDRANAAETRAAIHESVERIISMASGPSPSVAAAQSER